MKALPPAMSKQGGGLAKFIGNPNAVTKAMDLPAAQQTVDVSATDVTPKPTVAPKALPAADLSLFIAADVLLVLVCNFPKPFVSPPISFWPVT